MSSIYHRILCLFLGLICMAAGRAQQRSIVSINSNWQFHKGDIAGPAQAGKSSIGWEAVSLPHTWNGSDVADDEPGYYRGTGWYRKTLYTNPAMKGKEIYLRFEGANQVTEVFVNGKPVGAHTGGYTAFSFPVGAFLQ